LGLDLPSVITIRKFGTFGLSPAAVEKLFSLTNFNAVDVCVPLKIYFI
jgi:hypothetical protein